MSTITQTLGTATSIAFTGSALSTLADQTYVTSTAAVDLTSTTPLDVLLEAVLTPGTVSGNKQGLLFVQVSLDGTNYSTGPTSSSSATDEGDLYFVGVIPLNTNSTAQRKAFSLLAQLGFLPRYFKPVVRNDSGAAFSAGTVQYQTVINTIT